MASTTTIKNISSTSDGFTVPLSRCDSNCRSCEAWYDQCNNPSFCEPNPYIIKLDEEDCVNLYCAVLGKRTY